MTSTRDQVDESYSVSNDFFQLWLDEGMHYTSASYLTGEETLEQAQVNKAKILYDFAEITPDKVVLDIGCGWGSNLEYVAARGVKEAHGITLSEAQHAWIERRGLPKVKAWLQDFYEYQPESLYDSIQSIEMVDHICSPQQANEGRAVDLYRDYFKRCASFTKDGGLFACQAILRNRVPRTRKDLEDLAFTADVIFPGGLNPRLEELVAAVNPHWEILELRTQRTSYGRTTAEWYRRLQANESLIRERWGDKVYDDYDRYLGTCVRAFHNHWSSDVQMKLKKILV